MDTSNTFNNEGQLTNFTYPLNTDNYQHGFDSMGRLLSLTNVTTSTTLANGATYNAASQLTGLNYGPSLGWAETRTYNTLGQMTRITVPTVMDMEYTFHATQNNGQITKQKDYISGEEVNYTYDLLNRLLTADTTSTAWGLSFGYDGFGNKLSQTVTKGSAPAMSVTVDAATNRLVGSTYDANGNLTVGSGMTLTHDISNRIATASGPSSEWYGYAPVNKRVWKKRQTGGSTYEENLYFYSAGGQRLGTYTLTDTSGTLALTVKSTNVYFGGKLVKEGTTWVALDRLASVRARHDGTTLTTFDHFPYGEEKPSTTTQDRNKFATYFRDHTNLDYADQRYYTSGMGRFMTPDPLETSATPSQPDSWNRYVYVEGDPSNFSDPSGLLKCGEQPYTEDGKTRSAVALGNTNESYLARLIWAESSSDPAEMTGVAWTVINRWKIVNNQVQLRFPASQLSLGPENGSIADVIGYRGSFDAVKGDGNANLTDAFQRSLERVLESDYLSADCTKLHNAIAVAYHSLPPELGGTGLFLDPFRGRGLVTHFQRSPRVPDPHTTFFGPVSPGGITNFFGLTDDQIKTSPRQASACDPNSPDYRACMFGGRRGGGRGGR